MKYLLILALLSSGCSRALRFGFSFDKDGGGQSGNDLSGSKASKDMQVLPTDMTVSTADLAMSINDLMSLDMVNKIDQSSSPDLINPPTDMTTSDMPHLPSGLGGPCKIQSDCALPFTCFNQVLVGVSSRTFSDGYCTMSCSTDLADSCVPYGGGCRNIGGTLSICVRECGQYCPTDRGINYGCCTYQASPPNGPLQLLGCLPKNFSDISGFTCN